MENLGALTDQEYTFATPIVFTSGQQLILSVDCQADQPACDVGIYYTGPLDRAGGATPPRLPLSGPPVSAGPACRPQSPRNRQSASRNPNRPGYTPLGAGRGTDSSRPTGLFARPDNSGVGGTERGSSRSHRGFGRRAPRSAPTPPGWSGIA